MKICGALIPYRLPAPLGSGGRSSPGLLVKPVCVPGIMSALPSSPGFSCGHSSTALSRVSEKLAQLCSQSWASGNRFAVGLSFTITSRW